MADYEVAPRLFRISPQVAARFQGMAGSRAKQDCVLEMAAAWQMFSPAWQPACVEILDEHRGRALFEEVYDWALGSGIDEKPVVIGTAVVVRRAMQSGVPMPRIAEALSLIARESGDRSLTLQWLESALFPKRPGKEA